MQNLNKHFKTLDELVQECIKMSPLVDIKDNVVYLKHVSLNSKNISNTRHKYLITIKHFSRSIALELQHKTSSLGFKSSTSKTSTKPGVDSPKSLK